MRNKLTVLILINTLVLIAAFIYILSMEVGYTPFSLVAYNNAIFLVAFTGALTLVFFASHAHTKEE
jgi:hypothetical protein